MAPERVELTPEQRAIVEAGDGPVVVIAGAGTGKTRVIVERVRWLLETKEDLLPEQILVLTYNVKAAAELATRIDEAVGVATRSRMSVSNFHSFCQRVLTESAADAGLPARPDVLDGVGQMLLLQDLRARAAPPLPHELRVPGLRPVHQPGEGRAGRARGLRPVRRGRAGRVRGPIRELQRAEVRLETQGNLGPLRKVRAGVRGPAGARASRRRPGRRVAGQRRRSRGPAHGRRRRQRAAAVGVPRRGPPEDRQAGRRLRARRRGARGRPAARARPRLPRLRGRARQARRPRLRRADRPRRPAVPDQAQRPAPLAAPVPVHPRRRVPGRERRPDRAHRAPRPHAGPARQRDGRGRRRPVDLPLPRRQLRRLRRVRRAVLEAARARPQRPRARHPAAASGSSRTSAPSATS